MLTWRMHGARCAGQANYGYGNHACASLCRMRRKLGLPGLTVGWGAVANVGYVVENEQVLVSAPVQAPPAVRLGRSLPTVHLCSWEAVQRQLLSGQDVSSRGIRAGSSLLRARAHAWVCMHLLHVPAATCCCILLCMQRSFADPVHCTASLDNTRLHLINKQAKKGGAPDACRARLPRAPADDAHLPAVGVPAGG